MNPATTQRLTAAERREEILEAAIDRVRRARAPRHVDRGHRPRGPGSRSPTSSGSSARRRSSSSRRVEPLHDRDARAVRRPPRPASPARRRCRRSATAYMRACCATRVTLRGADAGLRGLRRPGDRRRRARRLRRASSSSPSGSPAPTTSESRAFFATGMLLNVLASMQAARTRRAVGASRCSRAAARGPELALFLAPSK